MNFCLLNQLHKVSTWRQFWYSFYFPYKFDVFNVQMYSQTHTHTPTHFEFNYTYLVSCSRSHEEDHMEEEKNKKNTQLEECLWYQTSSLKHFNFSLFVTSHLTNTSKLVLNNCNSSYSISFFKHFHFLHPSPAVLIIVSSPLVIIKHCFVNMSLKTKKKKLK